jgi:predicted RNA methylase
MMTHKVEALIIYADSTQALYALKNQIYAGIRDYFTSSGDEASDTASLTPKFERFLYSALSSYVKEFKHDEECRDAVTLSDEEKDCFCREYASRYFSYDINEYREHMRNDASYVAARFEREIAGLETLCAEVDRLCETVPRCMEDACINSALELVTPSLLSVPALGRRTVDKGSNSLIIDEAILRILSEADIEGNILRLSSQLDKRTYSRVDEVIQSLGGQWKTKAKGHVFKDNPSRIIEEALLSGAVALPDDHEFFQTPHDLANFVVGISGLEPGMKVVEPEAGGGRLAIAAGQVVGIENVDCFEIDPNNVSTLREAGFNVVEGDFLLQAPRPIYDLALMNPPFSKGQDVKHVMHALKFLKPTGRVVAIMSSGVTFRNDRMYREFRELMERANGGIIENPAGSFKESGASVGTVTVRIDAAGVFDAESSAPQKPLLFAAA